MPAGLPLDYRQKTPPRREDTNPPKPPEMLATSLTSRAAPPDNPAATKPAGEPAPPSETRAETPARPSGKMAGVMAIVVAIMVVAAFIRSDSLTFPMAPGSEIPGTGSHGLEAVVGKPRESAAGGFDDLKGKVTKMSTADGLDYLFFLPKNWTPEKKHPVLVFLHGRGESGGFDVTLRQSLPLQLNTNATAQDAFPFITIMPSCPWSCAMANEWQDATLQATTELVNDVVSKYNGDYTRVTLAGQSMGGNGAWEYAAMQKGVFSSLVVVCGYTRNMLYSTSQLGKQLKDIPIWVFHAHNDVVIPVDASSSVVRAFKEDQSRTAELRYTESGTTQKRIPRHTITTHRQTAHTAYHT
uniref:Phospholipase/carboxylesterase/thioesterase domain-containing protein n=1 Tax=Lotharella globosa TaxID=91324 RepID=A0A7S3YPD0_9EUKA